jgi:AAA+ superfamily predicted ATPase
MTMTEKLANYFKAGYPCLAILTTEEKRAQGDLISAARTAGKKVAVWSSTEGLVHVSDSGRKVADTDDLLSALRALHAEAKEDITYIMRDVHQWPFDRDPVLTRMLRDAATEAPARGCCIVLLAPLLKPSPSLDKIITRLEYGLPDAGHLKLLAKGIQDSVQKPIEDASDDVITALGGLSSTEAENALALSVIETGGFSPEVIYREKVEAVRSSGLLELAEPEPLGLDSIGGLENLKDWILKRRNAYSPEAQAYGLPVPKGVLLAGVPGSGKSLSAKAIGSALGIPTLKLDIGSLFCSLVGESEARTRDALRLAEAMAPCIIIIEEIDKGLSGMSGSSDSGVSRRVFGTLLTWMQEKKRPVFCVMTANSVDTLPPEFLRRGRFDELFAVDIPHAGEREHIAEVVLKKLGRDPGLFDLEAIAKASEGFTGAEIEAAASEALYHAFDAGRPMCTHDLVAAAERLIPLSKTMAEKIDEIRRWGRERARPASLPASSAKAPSGQCHRMSLVKPEKDD